MCLIEDIREDLLTCEITLASTEQTTEIYLGGELGIIYAYRLDDASIPARVC